MDRLLTAVVFVLVVIALLPTVAAATQPLIPWLVGFAVTLVLLRALWPGSRGR